MLLTGPPSLQLPPVRSLATLSPDALIDCIEYLRVLYSPGVRGSKIRARFRSDSSSESTASSSAGAPLLISDSESDTIAALRSDEFERSYTLRWVSYLVNNSEKLPGTPPEVDYVLARAASLLANCGGASSAGVISRTLQFPTERGPISVTVQDIPLENGDISSVGAQTWGGACVLSEIIAAQPADFGLVNNRSSPLAVLELGAGTGLVGLVLASVAKSLRIGGVTVVATDFYPAVLENLATNISAAFPASDRAVSISSHFLDWSAFTPDMDPLPVPLDGPFDVILGADIVYEPEHATWIHAVVSRLLAPGSSSQFHLVIPLRRTHALESSSVEQVFRDSSLGRDPTTAAPTILGRERIVCDVEGNATDEVEYLYYRIGWSC
ncbi:putative methyltransferase-domain-containing protein [Mycena sanguinolenta]|nr:putative methyltransferase-domain-containing protein [Mycena sanguinolenta]